MDDSTRAALDSETPVNPYSLLDVRVGDGTMVASVDPTTRAKVSEDLRLAINPARLHFFDAETEAAV